MVDFQRPCRELVGNLKVQSGSSGHKMDLHSHQASIICKKPTAVSSRLTPVSLAMASTSEAYRWYWWKNSNCCASLCVCTRRYGSRPLAKQGETKVAPRNRQPVLVSRPALSLSLSPPRLPQTVCASLEAPAVCRFRRRHRPVWEASPGGYFRSSAGRLHQSTTNQADPDTATSLAVLMPRHCRTRAWWLHG